MVSSAKTLAELRRLPIEERIELVEDLWDTIADDATAESLRDDPDLADELRRRLHEHRQNPADARPVEEALARLHQLLASR